jgi:hypothetical protein
VSSASAADAVKALGVPVTVACGAAVQWLTSDEALKKEDVKLIRADKSKITDLRNCFRPLDKLKGCHKLGSLMSSLEFLSTKNNISTKESRLIMSMYLPCLHSLQRGQQR